MPVHADVQDDFGTLHGFAQEQDFEGASDGDPNARGAGVLLEHNNELGSVQLLQLKLRLRLPACRVCSQ